VKIFSLLTLALATGTLLAQEAPRLDARFQAFAEMSWPTSIVVAQAPNSVSNAPGSQTGIGFRFLGELASAQNFYYELGGMFDATSYFTLSGVLPDGVTTLDLTDAKFTDSYWSLGMAYLSKPNENLSLGAHLEGRGEYLRLQGGVAGTNFNPPVQLDHSTTYLRPWVRGSVDYTFTGVGSSAHPYLGLEGCLAVLKTSQTRVPDFTNLDDRTVKALAPKYSAAVYAGIRF
jgi:hypothetical protein